MHNKNKAVRKVHAGNILEEKKFLVKKQSDTSTHARVDVSNFNFVLRRTEEVRLYSLR
jgi:hypothetical protein